MIHSISQDDEQSGQNTFTPHLKLISFINPFLHSHSYSFRTDFTDLNLYCIKGAHGVVCFSFFFWLRVLDKAEYSAFESSLNSPIVSYRIGYELMYTTLRTVHRVWRSRRQCQDCYWGLAEMASKRTSTHRSTACSTTPDSPMTTSTA